jgi:hypothetical protein
LGLRNLLLVLAFILSDGTSPLYAALGDAPRCLPPEFAKGMVAVADANPRIPVLRQVAPSFDPTGRDYLIRTIVFEASGEPEEGKAAVAHVILNRQKSGRWGDNIKDVVTHPWQFEPWMTKRKQMESLSPTDPRYQNAARIADEVLAGETPDPTAGATHFLNPTIVRQRRGGSLPSWAQGNGQPIGRHTFYSPQEDNALPQQAGLSLGIMADTNLMLTPRGGKETEGGCGRNALTARSPSLPAGIVDLASR